MDQYGKLFANSCSCIESPFRFKSYFLDDSVLVTGSAMTNFPSFLSSSNVNYNNMEWKWPIHLISSWYCPGNVCTSEPIWLSRTPFHSVVIIVSWADEVVENHHKKLIGNSHCRHFKGQSSRQWKHFKWLNICSVILYAFLINFYMQRENQGTVFTEW